MKCSNHSQTDARAICIYCGVGVCGECAERTVKNRIVCSTDCANALAEEEAALQGIRAKTLGGHRLTGYFALGAAVILAGFSAFTAIGQQWEILAFQLPLTLGLAISGIFYLRLGSKKS
jgi:hypothetical protein